MFLIELQVYLVFYGILSCFHDFYHEKSLTSMCCMLYFWFLCLHFFGYGADIVVPHDGKTYPYKL